jgi:hypothetical protein
LVFGYNLKIHQIIDNFDDIKLLIYFRLTFIKQFDILLILRPADFQASYLANTEKLETISKSKIDLSLIYEAFG